MSTPSQASFFRGVALELWRRVVPPEATRQEVAFLLETLALPVGAPVLDVPCGHGRHAIPFAETGLRVTAVDSAPEALADVEAAARRGLPLRPLLRDVRELQGLGPFAAALCLGNSFGYLDHEGNLAFLRAVAAELAPGGRFVLDTSVAAESVLPAFRRRDALRVPGIAVDVENTYDPAAGQLVSHYRFVEGTGTEAHTTTATLRYAVYTTAELGRLLRQAGLEVEQHLVGTSREPFRLGAPRLLLVARRPPRPETHLAGAPQGECSP